MDSIHGTRCSRLPRPRTEPDKMQVAGSNLGVLDTATLPYVRRRAAALLLKTTTVAEKAAMAARMPPTNI